MLTLVLSVQFAEIGAGTLLRCLLIAAVIVTPYFIFQRRQVRAARAELAEQRGEQEVQPPPADPNALETLVALIEEIGTSHVGDDAPTVTLMPHPTVDGRPADQLVIDAIVADALRRSGLHEIGRTDTDQGQLLRLQHIQPTV